MLLFVLLCHENVSQSSKRLHRIRGGKMGAPGVRYIKLFLKYLHPWSTVFMHDVMS